MEQVTFADVEYEGKKRRTRRELFLERMEALIPWERLEARIRPLYPKAGRGRQPYPLAALLRVHCVQLFYNLSDPGMEDMLYEIESVRRFAGLRLTGPLPDETTILNFRHLLERHGLGRGLFEEINAQPGGAGLPGAGGDDRGREHHRGAVIDEEPGGGAGSGDASDEEGQRVALRDEGAHRGGRGDGTGAWRAGDAGEHARSSGGGGVASRRRGGGVGGRGLPGDREVGGHGRPSGAVACGDETGAAAAPGAGRGAVAARAGQGLGAGKGGAPVPVCEAALRLPEGSLPRAGQEHGTDRAAPGLREPARGGPLFDGVSGRRGKHPPTRGPTRGSSARTCRFGAFFSPSLPPRPLKPAPSVPHRPQKGLAQSFPKARLKVLGLRPGDRFEYVYDFGDAWTHNILVEDAEPFIEDDDLPIVIDGARAGPPEDTGGIHTYQRLLDALSRVLRVRR